MATRATLYRRVAERQLSAALSDTPVVLIHGPRQCGKTTLAQQIGNRRRYRYYTFDHAATLASARADITGFVSRLEPHVIIDEVQHVPELFAALKPVVDSQRDSVRFILTGSSNILLIPRLSDSLAGRMEVVRLFPLSQSELERAQPSFVTTLFSAELNFTHTGGQGKLLAERIARGGYPVVQKRTAKRRDDWYANYVDALVQRDVREMTRIGDLSAIPKLLALAATQTARLANLSEMASSFELSRPTIASYLTLIERLFLIEYLPPWFSNGAKRLIKTPKLHFADTGLACNLLHSNATELDEQRDLLGQLLETFVFGELSKQTAGHSERVALYHLRDKDGYEVDIVLQAGNRIAGVEVKAGSSVGVADFAGLRRLRELVGRGFTQVLFFVMGITPWHSVRSSLRSVSALWAS